MMRETVPNSWGRQQCLSLSAGQWGRHDELTTRAQQQSQLFLGFYKLQSFEVSEEYIILSLTAQCCHGSQTLSRKGRQSEAITWNLTYVSIHPHTVILLHCKSLAAVCRHAWLRDQTVTDTGEQIYLASKNRFPPYHWLWGQREILDSKYLLDPLRFRDCGLQRLVVFIIHKQVRPELTYFGRSQASRVKYCKTMCQWRSTRKRLFNCWVRGGLTILELEADVQ
jgi:hypothetical protein